MRAGTRSHRRLPAVAAALLTAAALSGCVLAAPPAPVAAPIATPEPAPEPPATTPTAPTPAPTAADGGTPVLDSHGCSTPMVAALLDTNATLHVREGFLHPELLEGTEVACALTRPAEPGEDFATYSIAVVEAGPDVLDRIDAAVLASGLEPDPWVWGIYQTGDGTPVGFLNAMPDWARIGEVSPVPDGAEDWVVLLWYEPVA